MGGTKDGGEWEREGKEKWRECVSIYGSVSSTSCLYTPSSSLALEGEEGRGRVSIHRRDKYGIYV